MMIQITVIIVKPDLKISIMYYQIQHTTFIDISLRNHKDDTTKVTSCPAKAGSMKQT